MPYQWGSLTCEHCAPLQLLVEALTLTHCNVHLQWCSILKTASIPIHLGRSDLWCRGFVKSMRDSYYLTVHRVEG